MGVDRRDMPFFVARNCLATFTPGPADQMENYRGIFSNWSASAKMLANVRWTIGEYFSPGVKRSGIVRLREVYGLFLGSWTAIFNSAIIAYCKMFIAPVQLCPFAGGGFRQGRSLPAPRRPFESVGVCHLWFHPSQAGRFLHQTTASPNDCIS